MSYELALRTDKPEAELYIFCEGKVVAQIHWEAHRMLAETLHEKVAELLHTAGTELSGLTKVLVYTGPGSFTGLRIGISVANALAYSLSVPIVGACGDNWLEEARYAKPTSKFVVPFYGSDPHITKQKK
jgi:tRNA threonylcarbamoyladenosine biosynthesis protein TsaB